MGREAEPPGLLCGSLCVTLSKSLKLSGFFIFKKGAGVRRPLRPLSADILSASAVLGCKTVPAPHRDRGAPLALLSLPLVRLAKRLGVIRRGGLNPVETGPWLPLDPAQPGCSHQCVLPALSLSWGRGLPFRTGLQLASERSLVTIIPC